MITLKNALSWLDENLEMSICVVLMSVMTVLIFVQVIMRYVFSNSLSWSEELARYVFIWLIYLGISYGAKIRKHIKIDAAMKLFPASIRPYVTIVGDICFFLFAVYITITGYKYVGMQATFNKVSPALHIPYKYVFAAPMVGFCLVCYRQYQTIKYRIDCIKRGEEWTD
ncbi:TRAP transporter small permease [Tepidanaerobacter sp. EBM-38]|uniref:TRAP transporter small permease n=1 Tax=Tepidanaerobacter sp. EBM-38 TaxID=1918496 RepID=UPI0025E681AE|nr:TRAP transporter small permease [Tepidanaerobacter sp. EBM-38]